MTTEQSNQLTDQQIEDVINVLESADAYHHDWLCRFHAALICGLDMNADMINENAHTLCNFGHWYYTYASPILTRRQTFIDLEQLHDDMHAAARRLAKEAAQGKKILQADYQIFTARQREFSDAMKILRDQMYERLYSYDKLTGLMTRGPFMHILESESAREYRFSESSCLVMMDIDHFKQINDDYGHLAGDRVLVSTARYLRKHMRLYDSICRYGGEEFLVLLPNTDIHQAQEIIERIRVDMEKHKIEYESGRFLNITASFGISILSDNIGYQNCLKNVDAALYKAKTLGRNKVCTG
ncbi:MAG: diguanylate cyclase [Pseudomonadota bacterium]|nr:diguanylate cyclase [Pseudomonadota bacterium]